MSEPNVFNEAACEERADLLRQLEQTSDPSASSPVTQLSPLPENRKRKGSETPVRCQTARSNCKTRDNSTCIITGAEDPVEVAHIFPFSFWSECSTQPKDVTLIWHGLRLLWSDERVTAWYNAIFPTGNTEGLHNLICLSPSVHSYHERHRFALKPIELSNDEKVQRVELRNVETEQRIYSGDEIILKTDDPLRFPLPSLALLEMRWYLQRIAALRGGGEQPGKAYNDESDEENCDELVEGPSLDIESLFERLEDYGVLAC
ncbi:hypothetical protein FQN57_006572 [Myotisia sp. PD_48]|nr:hypothetical protein FQN57_006572 [Myotisia sp. PD_48]